MVAQRRTKGSGMTKILEVGYMIRGFRGGCWVKSRN